jgi:hypothetical protein
MRLANHGVSALVRSSRLPVFACAMMRTVRRDTRRAYVAPTRDPGTVGGRSAPPRGHLETDGPHRTGRLPSRYGSIMRICWRIRNRYLR